MFSQRLLPSCLSGWHRVGGLRMRLRVAGACQLAPRNWLNFADYIAKLVVRAGVEPPAFRFSGASAASLHVAGVA
jgi:hypothetical protein